MSEINCDGCNSGTDSGNHWHDPIPNGIFGLELEKWWNEQAKHIKCDCCVVCNSQEPENQDDDGLKDNVWYCTRCRMKWDIVKPNN